MRAQLFSLLFITNFVLWEAIAWKKDDHSCFNFNAEINISQFDK